MASDSRTLQVTSALGPDAFVLESFSGVEALSQPFSFELHLGSAEASIAPADVVGKPMAFSIQSPALGERAFHGRVRRLVAGPIGARGVRSYRAHVVPWLWFLTKRQGCRVFQNKTPSEIAGQIFDELGFSDRRFNIRGGEPTLEYRVQYRESDFQFLTRLFEEFGLFYFFEHTSTAHTLVVADAKGAYVDCMDGKVRCDPRLSNSVASWERAFEYTSGKWTARDYDFTKSQTPLESSVSTVVDLANASKFEVYEHPGAFSESADGDGKVKAWLEAEEATHDVARGESTCIAFRPGGKFELDGHEDAAQNKGWVLTSVRHDASESAGPGEGYRNSFTCMLATRTFRPPPRTPKPLIHGLQTAVVVGPSSEEIYTDEHGRVRVQFHWDREGKKDADSSCWIRVAQPWAGKSFGAFHLPRIGQEVVVSFVEGDPDRPLVIGSVYNDAQTPPFPLPADKTQTGLRTRSTPEGAAANANELRFEDKKDEELLFLHAEKDELHEVENDQTVDVGHDQSIAVGNDCSEDVTRDRTLHVGNHHSDTVDKNRTISIGENHDETVGGTMKISVTKSRSLAVGEDLTEDVTGKRSLSVGKDSSTSVTGAMTIEVTKDLTLRISGNQVENVTKDLTVTAKKIQITASDEISISAGKASITLKKDGAITIDGGKIQIEGSGDVSIKGSKVSVN
jgi:type VI secretion system secreted protein VgrG